LAAPWREEPESVMKPGPSGERRFQSPALEQNLDKLAEAYFTGPPEQRERAVQGLLHELEAALIPNEEPAPATAQPRKEEPAPHGVPCPSCQRESRPGQRFCGYCGVPLYSDVPPDFADSGGGILGLSPTFSDDMQFLREKTFGGVYAEDYGAPSHWGRWIAAAIVLLLIGLGYREWNSLGRPRTVAQLMAAARPAASPQRASAVPAIPAPQPLPAAPAASSITGPPPAAQTPPPAAQEATAAPSPAPVKPEGPPPSAARSAPSATPPPPQAANAAHQSAAPEVAPAKKAPEPSTLTLASDSQRTSAPDNGSQELNLAQRYLNQHDPSVAARWLWKALGKQNGRAALLLADLYQTGNGVPQSCDQARLLLMAAAKKGVAGADTRLQSFESGSCR